MRKNGLLSLIVISVIAVGWLTYTLTLGGQSPQLGLDLQGGTSVVLAPKTQTNTGAIDQAIEIIRRRVDGLGVAEPEIIRQGDFIVVSLPGVKDQERAIQVVGRTARLQFRPVCQVLPTGLGDAQYEQALATGGCGPAGAATTVTPSTTPDTTAATLPVDTTPATTPTTQAGLGVPAGHLSVGQTPTSDTTPTSVPTTDTSAPATTTTPAPTTTQASGPPCGVAGDGASEVPDEQAIIATTDSDKNGAVDGCELLGPVALSGTAVSDAQAAIPQGEWIVQLTLKDSGLEAWNAITAHCYDQDQVCPGNRVAIVLDGRVESDPRPEQRVFQSNQIQITGKFTQKQADDLALVLRYGSLPIELEQQRVETVSATLGHDSLRAGLIAGAIGLAAVAIYMIIYYRALGVVVVVGLAVWSALNYSIITWLSGNAGLALSLSGVTGIVVSVGVTTDSYIVYFERMKDDVKSGRSIRAAVDHAFKGAWHTIVAADLASFIGAALLYWLTVGAVRGFAFFLGLSTMLDLVTAYFFKRPMVALLARSRFLREAKWIGISRGLAIEPKVEPVVGGGS
jgi:preprotein translocase subunit SecD